MINKFKRGLTAEEASLVATGLDRFDSLVDASRTLQVEEDSVRYAEAELTNPYNDEGISSMSWDDINTHDEDYKKLAEAELIREALLDEVSIACEWHDYLSGEVELYIHECITQPHNETTLEVFQIRRMAPDDEYSFCPIPAQTTIKKVSLAKWFYNNLPDKANFFDPTESYKTVDTGYSIANINEKETSNAVTPTTIQQLTFSEKIIQTNTWQDLYKQTEKAIDEFPVWQQQQRKPNNIPMGHIDDWLTNTLKVTKRESETIKKTLIEIFNL
ncbi:hypothetical protein E2K93_04740 [Thalassotalea sp. HSM 43]|uniref:hypothetical protein n=1 Tax=Thalassotalea sp. HSM 43 TaxID=2552945 RepID=UPI0010804041|nr:hypothetical protein [Thalassotalea sp. HSM 43]QBY03728.1 hypothetical protein E2K93_04740 [Thalassotalea sp. HSM 43]